MRPSFDTCQVAQLCGVSSGFEFAQTWLVGVKSRGVIDRTLRSKAVADFQLSTFVMIFSYFGMQQLSVQSFFLFAQNFFSATELTMGTTWFSGFQQEESVLSEHPAQVFFI
jgi:hypothetical protein